MDGHSLPSVEILKCALPKLQKPILFRNMLRNSDGSYEWKLLNWSFSDLVEKFEDKQLPFRVGDYNKCMVSYIHIYIYICIAIMYPISFNFILFYLYFSYLFF